jgi:hypothetical protein
VIQKPTPMTNGRSAIIGLFPFLPWPDRGFEAADPAFFFAQSLHQ